MATTDSNSLGVPAEDSGRALPSKSSDEASSGLSGAIPHAPAHEPTFDADGYPTDETLQRISEWDWHDPFGLAAYIQRAWNWPDMATLKQSVDDPKVHILRLATGGWSGNESIVAALGENRMFMMLFWHMSQRGGLAVYHIYEIERVSGSEGGEAGSSEQGEENGTPQTRGPVTGETPK